MSGFDLALADRAHEVLAEIAALGQQMTLRALRIGQLLAEVKADGLYRACGCDTFEDFCGLPEVGIGRTQAYRLMQIAGMVASLVPPVGPEGLAEHYAQLAAIGVKKLHQLVPLLREHPEQAAERLDQAEALSSSALRSEIEAAQGKERSEEAEWYVRRFQAIEALCWRAIHGSLPPGVAADEICAEAMVIQEKAKEG